MFYTALAVVDLMAGVPSGLRAVCGHGAVLHLLVHGRHQEDQHPMLLHQGILCTPCTPTALPLLSVLGHDNPCSLV